MKQDKAFNLMTQNLLGVGGGLGDMVGEVTKQPEMQQTQVRETRPASQQPKSRKSPTGHTVAQAKALDNVRNSQRGRGKKKGERKMIAFKAPVDLVDTIEDLTYKLSKSKNDLYEEALLDLVTKYQNI